MSRERDGLPETLAGIVGEDYVLRDGAAARFAVDGVAPRLAVRPGSQEEVAAVVAACGEAGAAMAPRGGGTAIGTGNPPSRLDVALGLDRLTRIVEFDAANLSVSAEAGVTLGGLQAVLNAEGEFLPLDPAHADRVTVGGLVQTNASGPGRLLYGSVRDWVLGLRVVLPGGDRIRCGGKVIKNVSGYDMNKLFIGSFGTMGVVTEATFKLLPLPAARATVVGVFRRVPDLAGAVTRALESFLLPEAMEALDPRALGRVGPALGKPFPPGFGIAISLAGSPENVERQTRDFTDLFMKGGAVAAGTLAPDRAEAAWRAIREVHAPLEGPGVVFKVAVPVGDTLDVFSGAEEALAACGEFTVTAHAGSGVVRAGGRIASAAAAERLGRALEALRERAERAEGSLVVEEAPPSLKRSLDAWGRAREGVAVMRALKAEFDPDALLNPGRFVGGI